MSKLIELQDILDGLWKGEESVKNSIFNENMSSSEARKAFFAAVDGKTKEEIEKLKADYYNVIPAIVKRESKLAEKGWMLS